MIYICDSFSLAMLPAGIVTVIFIPCEEPKTVIDKVLTSDYIMSAVDHPDTATVLGIPCNIMNITLNKGDILYVAQLQGGRLPEGATTLPEGFSFHWYKCFVE